MTHEPDHAPASLGPCIANAYSRYHFFVMIVLDFVSSAESKP